MAGQHEAGEAGATSGAAGSTGSTPRAGDTVAPGASHGATREAIEAARAQTPDAGVAPRTGAPVAGRQRAAAVICVAMAVVMVVTAVIGMGKLTTFQVVLDFAAAVVWLAAGWLLVRSGVRWLAVTIGWLTAAGMILELGDYQSRKNGSTDLTTSEGYFLPGLVWLYLFGLVVVAIVVGVLSKRRERSR
jgi:hypothetical protein